MSPNRRRREHRLSVLRAWLAGPAEIWLLVRMVAWSALLPVLKHLLSLPVLVRLMWAGKGRGQRWPEREQRMVQLAFWLYRSRRPTARGRCLERSLLLYRFLSLSHASPQLVAGVCKRGAGLLGHAWVSVEGQPVGESVAAVSEFVPVLMAGPGGQVQPRCR
jgi:Transglutaminase-like superfamily